MSKNKNTKRTYKRRKKKNDVTRFRRTLVMSVVIVFVLFFIGNILSKDFAYQWVNKEKVELSKEFLDKVAVISKDLGVDPDDLMSVMAFESRLDHTTVNKLSGATGLIQFMPETAKYLGTTTAELKQMTDIEQLDYVHKYLERYSGKLDTISDLYMAILWPAAVGEEEEYVLFEQGTITYKQNDGLDLNEDGFITKAEAVQRVIDNRQNFIIEESRTINSKIHNNAARTIRVSEIIYGDVNGDTKVNTKDYAMLQQYLNGWDVTVNEKAADTNGDGKVNMKDYALLQQYLNGWNVTLGGKVEGDSSTTEEPDTEGPTTETPDTDNPTTEMPDMDNPTTEAPDTEEPSTQEPGEGEDEGIRFEKKVYGKSVLGKDLEYYSFTPANYSQTVLFNFAIHGYEDEYDKDGQVLVDTANRIIDYYKNHEEMLHNSRLIVIPCANPDGLYDGHTKDGFGRCNADGVDLNRDFDANYKPNSTDRNYTEYAFSAPESRALRDLVLEIEADVVLDFHGWYDYTIGDYELAQVFEEEMGLEHYTHFTTTNASGYFANWAHQQGALGLLVEFTNSTSISEEALLSASNRILAQDYLYSKKVEDFRRFDKITCYTLSEERVTTYQYFDKPFSKTSYIDGATDEVTILGIYENGWAKVQYPITTGVKVAYVKLAQLIDLSHQLSLEPYTFMKNTTVYKRADLAEKHGTAYTTDECFVAADNGKALQIIYQLDKGGWKMGWIAK